MSKPARRLGRGLNSLLSSSRTDATPPVPIPIQASDLGSPDSTQLAPPANGKGTGGIRATMVKPSQLKPNKFQPRNSILSDNISSLAASIEQSGILQPIAVRECENGYEIIAGERRWRAAKSIGLREIPVIIREATDEQMLELALVENLQREDLNAIDRAQAYRQFCDKFELTPEEVAKRLGEDRTTVVNYLRLLDLDESLRDWVANGTLSMGHARCLVGVRDGVERMRLAEKTIEQQLSVRALEELVRAGKRGSASPTATHKQEVKSPHLREMERKFEQATKTKVVILEGKRKTTGKILIDYYSLDDFDRVAGLLGVVGE